MAFSKPFTDEELAYIRGNYPKKTCEEIAEDLGRSRRGVYNKVRDMGLRKTATGKPAERPQARVAGAHTLDELAGVLWLNIQAAEPRDVAKLAKEYRECLAEIEKQKGGGVSAGAKSKPAADPIAERLKLVAGR